MAVSTSIHLAGPRAGLSRPRCEVQPPDLVLHQLAVIPEPGRRAGSGGTASVNVSLDPPGRPVGAVNAIQPIRLSRAVLGFQVVSRSVDAVCSTSIASRYPAARTGLPFTDGVFGGQNQADHSSATSPR